MSVTKQGGVSPGVGASLGAGVGGFVGPVTYTFDGTDDGISFSDIALTGDFSISATLTTRGVVTPPDASGMVMWGDMANLTWVRIEPDGKIRFKIAGFTETSAIGIYPLDNLEHTFEVSRVGTQANYIVDGVTLDTDVLTGTALDPVIFNTLGFKGDNSEFKGIMKDAKLVGTQTGTGTPLNLHWPINDGFAANPVIAEINVGGGTWDGTALNFNIENWS